MAAIPQSAMQAAATATATPKAAAAAPAAMARTAAEPPELSFQVLNAAAERYAAAPTVNFTLGIERHDGGEPVRAILLGTQIQIAARLRPYSESEQGALVELFGAPERWGETLRTLLWTHATLVVPPFAQHTEATLAVPCSYDLQASAAGYLAGLADGEVPLEFLFSGSIFYTGPGGQLQITRISWELQAAYRLPVAVWREAMDRHFPGAAWACLERPTFERLRAYKAEHGLHTLGEAVARLLGEE